MSDDGWFKWTGGPPPFTGGKKVRVRIRCRTRGDALKQEPLDPAKWKWMHTGGPGDIMEWRFE